MPFFFSVIGMLPISGYEPTHHHSFVGSTSYACNGGRHLCSGLGLDMILLHIEVKGPSIASHRRACRKVKDTMMKFETCKAPATVIEI